MTQPQTAREINNREDLLDVRDIIERFEEIETELTEAKDGQSTQAEAMSLEEWIDYSDAVNHPFQEAFEEYLSLKSLLEDLEGQGGDHQWQGSWYPVTLIRDSYFEDYAQQLAEDIGAINADASWPNNCIDWEKAVRELQMDYTTVDFGDETYWTS